MIYGIDYAGIDRNAKPDVSALRAGGYRFAIVRAALGAAGYAYPDATFTRDRDRLAAGGITVGAFLGLGYDKSGPTPEAQVARFVEVVGDRRPGELPPWIDVEFSGGRQATGLTAKEAVAWIERGRAALVDRYGIVGTYTSSRVWHEDLADLPCSVGDGPLWLKVPYPYKARNPPHLEERGHLTVLPPPWQTATSPSAWIVQFQGDAIGVPGMTSTVDVSYWLEPAMPSQWLAGLLGGERVGVGEWQARNGLPQDGHLGPATFAALTA